VTFTETDVREFFDQTLEAYLAFWDSNGVLHTGYFADDADDDYHGASDRTTEIVAADAGLTKDSYVLDVGCGCGNFLMGLAEQIGFRGVGLDLSEERIKFAREKLGESNALDVRFDHGSATDMPYPEGEFSHVVSQDALCLVPDKPKTHTEIFRVLQPGGTFAFSDFLQPKPEISERSRKHVYDRVRWNGGYSFLGYQQALTDVGFEIVLARNVANHLGQTYRVLRGMALENAETTKDSSVREWMEAFAVSCQEIQHAIADGEFGWGIFVARKPA
jgi:cyclopropane fatty-acyl-phospholipid synthase-like methyltransferase